jgi:hypothetical protein
VFSQTRCLLSCLKLTASDAHAVAGLDVEIVEEAVLRALKRQKASEASISNFSTEHWSRMALAAGLTMRAHECLEVDDGSCKEAPAFQWNDESEPKQADRYAQAPPGMD